MALIVLLYHDAITERNQHCCWRVKLQNKFVFVLFFKLLFSNFYQKLNEMQYLKTFMLKNSKKFADYNF